MSLNTRIVKNLIRTVEQKANKGMWPCRRRQMVYWSQMLLKEIRIMLRSGEITLNELMHDEFSTPVMDGVNAKYTEKYLLNRLRSNFR